MSDNTQKFTILVPPKPVGQYTLFPGAVLVSFKKPNTMHRYFTKLLLGWVWKDLP
jgi:hypothetical protein